MSAKPPKEILMSVSLLTGIHIVGLWQMILLSRTLGVALWMPYSALVVVYVGLAALLAMILFGKSWARTVYSILTIFGAIILLGSAEKLDMPSIALNAIRFTAVALLYLPVSNLWFSPRSLNGHNTHPVDL